MLAGIPVINLDRIFDSPLAYRTWIGGDNYGMGVSAGNYIGLQLRQRNVANPIIGEVAGIDSLPLTQQRSQGFRDALATFGFSVGPRQAADFTAQGGQRVTANLLQAAPRLDALWNHDDDQGIGVLAAIQQANRSEFFMVGGAGSANAMRAIQADNTVLKATVTYSADDGGLGRLAGPARRAGPGDERPGGAGGPGVDHAGVGHGDQGQRGAVPAAGLRVLMGTPHRGRLGVGMVGYAFMGAAHSQAWRTAARFFDLPLQPDLAVLCGRDKDKASAAAEKLGWRSVETDWRALLARDDVGLVDVCSPGDTHAEIAIAALDAGKHVLCEKPLANTVDEARAMVAAAVRARLSGASAAWSATATGACPRWRWPAGSSSRAGSGRSGTCARSTCRTGSSTPSSRWSGGCSAARRDPGRWATSARTSSTWRST